jgi:gliding motility-associated-like protein
LVKNQYGCIAADSIIIDEHCIDIVQIPNSFTPNEDGIDDDFGGITNSPNALVYYSLIIFNRWGQEVFHTNDYNLRWNGNFGSAPQPIGTYVCLLEYNFDKNQPNILLKGDLILLR